ncbi:hypothetical protein ACFVQB_14865 [Paenibacillus sp. NPDC057886]|uniref:hypothetical protein n=1 Tax=Paenibacillus sp. NPDC057886 TaxID=3346270 RepID=UPI0036AD35C1
MIGVDTKKLVKGQVYKNYKEICLSLNEKVKTGNAKISQLNLWESFFDYSRDGNKFIINEVYKKPKGKQSSRYGFINNIEELVLDLLVQDKHNGKVFFPRSRLLKNLNMVNSNYNFGRYNIPKLSELLKVNELNVREFYDLSNTALTRALERSLNNLQEKSLVFWHLAKTVVYVEPQVETNRNGDLKVIRSYIGNNEFDEEIYDYGLKYNVRRVYKEATETEIQYILDAERQVMDELNITDKKGLVTSGKWDEYTRKVGHILLEDYNIHHYFDSYKIICNESYIYTLWDELKMLSLTEEERNILQSESNSEVKSNLLNNARKRHSKASSIDTFLSTNVDIRRSDPNYIEQYIDLLNNLIDRDNRDIRQDIKIVNLPREIKSK